MISVQKNSRIKDRKYLDWVDSLGCCICRQPSKAHHIIGVGRGKMGGKDHDYLTMPLCNNHHSSASKHGVHNSVKKWEASHQPQAYYVIDTLNNALNENIISHEIWLKHIEICEKIIDTFKK